MSQASETERVRNLGDEIGYGRTMQLCTELWRESLKETGLAGAELVTGPCQLQVFPCVCRETETGEHCEWCCGCGWLTSAMKGLLEENKLLREGGKGYVSKLAYGAVEGENKRLQAALDGLVIPRDRLEAENKLLQEAIGKSKCHYCGFVYSQNPGGCEDVDHVRNGALLDPKLIEPMPEVKEKLTIDYSLIGNCFPETAAFGFSAMYRALYAIPDTPGRLNGRHSTVSDIMRLYNVAIEAKGSAYRLEFSGNYGDVKIVKR